MQRSAFSVKENLRQLLYPPNTHFTPLNGLRALSILWVFSFHVVHMVGDSMRPSEFATVLARPAAHFIFHGHYGVDVFFVISGFLIGNLLLEEQDRTQAIDYRRFYMRRFIRLCPVYFFLMVEVLIGTSLAGVAIPVDFAWANFLYVNNFVAAHHQFMAWTWSLAIEEQFYVVCPLLITLLPRPRAIPVLLSLLLIGFGVRYGVLALADEPVHMVLSPALDRHEFENFFDVFYDKTYTRYGGLLCGVIAAYTFRYTKFVTTISEKKGLSVALLVAALAVIGGLFACYDYLNWQASSGRLFLTVERYLFSACVAVIMLLSLSPRGIGSALGRALSHRVFYPVAQLSYSIYLIHPIILFMGMKSWHDANQRAPASSELTVLGLVLGAITLVCSALLFLAIEKPGMRLRK